MNLALSIESKPEVAARKPVRVPTIKRVAPGEDRLHRLAGQCACGGGCPRCQQESRLQSRMRQGGYQPEPIDLCVGATGPPKCEFTEHQQRTLLAVRYDARSVAQRALSAISRGDTYMATVAARVFHISDPNMGEIGNTVAGILDRLRDVPLSCGSCTDDTCKEAGTPAYTENDLSHIVICQPRFFAQNLVQQRRTLIHEAAHAFGIDAARAARGDMEHYCHEDSGVECTDPCGNLTGDLRQNVDAWARFIECAAFSS
ncbi:MAG TPA: hypothetical protein VKB86_19530 [Pyrinomonadaceae bacterium]|nr:hypothetical protein [Pyrinomonadaceae bacterium]